MLGKSDVVTWGTALQRFQQLAKHREVPRDYRQTHARASAMAIPNLLHGGETKTRALHHGVDAG